MSHPARRRHCAHPTAPRATSSSRDIPRSSMMRRQRHGSSSQRWLLSAAAASRPYKVSALLANTPWPTSIASGGSPRPHGRDSRSALRAEIRARRTQRLHMCGERVTDHPRPSPVDRKAQDPLRLSIAAGNHVLTPLARLRPRVAGAVWRTFARAVRLRVTPARKLPGTGKPRTRLGSSRRPTPIARCQRNPAKHRDAPEVLRMWWA